VAEPSTQAPRTEDDGDVGPGERRARALPGKEDKVATAVDRIVAAGTPRLHRSWPDLLATGTVAGLEVSVGVLALLVVKHATGSPLLAGLAFSFGFMALLLGHSELFTEGFLVPITVVAAKAARVRDLVRFWLGSFAGNLAGAWVMMWVVVQAFPDLRGTVVESATTFIDHGITLRAFCLAVLGGAAITMMTRMQNGTDSVPAKLVVSVAAAFVLAGLQLSHSVLESILMFGALHTGAAPFGYLDWLGWLGWAVLGNAVGGIGLVTVLRLVRSRELLAEHRDARS
jgi:formate/nitrite transporter FocA (FNT family)